MLSFHQNNKTVVSGKRFSVIVKKKYFFYLKSIYVRIYTE